MQIRVHYSVWLSGGRDTDYFPPFLLFFGLFSHLSALCLEPDLDSPWLVPEEPFEESPFIWRLVSVFTFVLTEYEHNGTFASRLQNIRHIEQVLCSAPTGINLVSSFSLYLFKFQFKKDDGVFKESTEHKDNAGNDPALYCCETLSLKR